MRIEFFNIEDGKVLLDTDNNLFVMNNEVYGDNGLYCESQEASVGFDDFVKPMPKFGWRVVA